MSHKIKWLISLISVALSVSFSQVYADFHLWTINEVFSNADGTVQYIELRSSISAQGNLSGHTLVASDGAQGSNSFQFASNLSGDTTNKTLLIATAKFTGLTGLQADYTIPESFLFVNGGTLNFGEGSATLTYTGGQLPKNGVQSINGSAQAQEASPVNFAGLGTAVSAPTYATFDDASSIMTVPVLNAPGIGIGNVRFSVNLATLQFTLLDGFYLYGAGISLGNNPAQFNNGSVLHLPALVVGSDLYTANLAILGDNPIRFGNPQVISVAAVPVIPTPDPVPTPTPDPTPPPVDQQSITRGQNLYASLCVACHGASGGGGIGLPLTTSSLTTFAALRSFIDTSMPQDAPGLCTDAGSSTCATDVANYVINVIQQGGGSSEVPDVEY
ncbi:MAG: c-type cytochrome [Pseudohongiellaceae bacterium]